MCNLYTMTAGVEELRRWFGPFAGDSDNLPPFDEIYPGHQAPVIRRADSDAPAPGDAGVAPGNPPLRLDMMRWGIPGPAAAGGRPVTNVRNLDSPFWRGALNNPARRCLVPVTRFCEWTAAPDPATGRKAKVWFGLHSTGQEQPLFAFAGLWRPGEGGPFMAFLTCAPNQIVGAVHPKAMPVMLRRDDARAWLDGNRDSACALAIPYADADMRIIPSA